MTIVGTEFITYLLVDSCSVAKHDVATQQTCNESIRAPFLPTVRLSLEQKKSLVDGDKFG